MCGGVRVCVCVFVYSQRQRLINGHLINGDSDISAKLPGRRAVENGLGGVERGLNGRRGGHRDDDRGGADTGTDTENENEDNENNENDEEEEEEDDNEGPFVPFQVPGTESLYSLIVLTV